MIWLLALVGLAAAAAVATSSSSSSTGEDLDDGDDDEGAGGAPPLVILRYVPQADPVLLTFEEAKLQDRACVDQVRRPYEWCGGGLQDGVAEWKAALVQASSEYSEEAFALVGSKPAESGKAAVDRAFVDTVGFFFGKSTADWYARAMDFWKSITGTSDPRYDPKWAEQARETYRALAENGWPVPAISLRGKDTSPPQWLADRLSFLASFYAGLNASDAAVVRRFWAAVVVAARDPNVGWMLGYWSHPFLGDAPGCARMADGHGSGARKCPEGHYRAPWESCGFKMSKLEEPRSLAAIPARIFAAARGLNPGPVALLAIRAEYAERGVTRPAGEAPYPDYDVSGEGWKAYYAAIVRALHIADRAASLDA